MFASPPPTGQAANPNHRYNFAPQTPSPLRTSRYANLMSSPISLDSTISQFADSKSSPLAPYSTLPPSPPTANSGPTHPSDAPQPQPHPESTEPRNRFSTRHLASTSRAQLSSQTSAAKQRRRTLFHDRIRQKREESRYVVRGDQALRMDFVRERREWMASRTHEAPEDAIQSCGFDEEEGGEWEFGQEEVGEEVGEEGVVGVPLTEEEDVQARAKAWMEEQEQEQEQEQGDSRGSERRVVSAYGSDEDDYEHLFMELIDAEKEMDLANIQQRLAQEPSQVIDAHSSMDLS